MNGVTIEALEARYASGRHSTAVLRNLSLRVDSGTLLTLLGPSGSGKTTLLRCIAGLVSPVGGRIEVDGVIFFDAALGRELRVQSRSLGMVFQSFGLWPHMTVAENIDFPLRIRRWEKHKRQVRVGELLRLVGLPDLGDRHPRQLSGGQQQRVGIARALSYEPSLLLMDEPLSSLDANLRLELRSYIRRLQKELGITVVYVTHDREEALALSDKIVILSDGRVVASGRPFDLYQDPPDPFTASFLSGWTPIALLGELAGRRDGEWVTRIPRKVPCRCNGQCMVALPGRLPVPLKHGDADDHLLDVHATVASVEFLGADVRIELQLPGANHAVFVTEREPSVSLATLLAPGVEVRVPSISFRLLCQPTNRGENDFPEGVV